MPRLPTYRLHKPSGRAVIQWRPLFGPNPHYLPGPYGSPESLEAYERIRAEILASIHRTPPPPKKASKHASLNSLLIAYLEHAQQYHGDKEYGAFRQVARVLKASHGNVKAADFGPAKLIEAREAMIRRNWSRGHINHQVNRVRRIFRWGAQHEWVDASVWLALRAVEGLRAGKTEARERPVIQPVDGAAVEAVLPFVSPIVATMIRLQELTAMRSDELTGMRPCEIDTTGEVWIYRPSQHKTAWRGRVKEIYLGPRAQSLLKPYWPDDQKAFIFRPGIAISEQLANRKAKRTSKVYGREKRRKPRTRLSRERYTAHSYQAAINHGFRAMAAAQDGIPRARRGEGRKPRRKLQPWLQSLGIVYWHPHQLRHTRATVTREAYGIEGAQAQTGNTLEAAEIYAEKSRDLARRIARETG